MIPPLPLLYPLEWFPKRFQPGDMDSSGGERLLGRTELSSLEILIRETAQNSWDAREAGMRPEYGLHLRHTDWRFRTDLERLLPDRRRQTPGSLGVDDPFVLEVFDRGTSGLDGPVTLRPVFGDAPRNFQDLILKVGVPRDDGKGGGTYGFGKTASYAFSRRGTVIYWTRCRNEDGHLEHRLIASAFRDSYVDQGIQYTGRHWWGRLDGEMILPVIGEEAETLGRRLFHRGFNGGETGTSMLILDPDLREESLGSEVTDDGELDTSRSDLGDEFAAKARSAIRIHLWPKLIVRPGETVSPMEITLQVDEVSHGLIDEPEGVLALWGAGLNAIRAQRDQSPGATLTPQSLPVRVFPITRLRSTLGHLAVVQRVPALETQLEDDDLDPIHNPAVSRIALMRGQPELIVSTVDWIAQSPMEGVEWIAVYKSADDWDAVYARTEPPAHDAWIASLGGEGGLVVKATRRQVIAGIRDVLYPDPLVAREPDLRPVRTAALSRRFAGILPAPVDRAIGDRSSPGGGGRRARANRDHRVETGIPRLVATLDDGRQRQHVPFIVRADAEQSIVTFSVSVIGDEGAHEPLAPDALEVSWTTARSVGPARALVAPGQHASVEFTAVGRRALRIDLSAEAHDGDR